MSCSTGCVLVLWGKRCQEVPTAVFVTTLRAAGVQVKLVGLSGQQTEGAYGLALLFDLTLSEALALAHTVTCVIIPCRASLVACFQNDPRLGQLLQTVCSHGARVIVSEECIRDLLCVSNPVLVETYPPDGVLLGYAHDLAQSLVA